MNRPTNARRAALSWLRVRTNPATPGMIHVPCAEVESVPDLIRDGLAELRDSREVTLIPGADSYAFSYDSAALRPSWDDLGMETAQLWALRSTHPTVQTGACILESGGGIVAAGYSGRYAGAPTERIESSDEPQYLTAVANVLLYGFFDRSSPQSHLTLYATHEPSPEDALLMLAASARRGLRRVVYRVPSEATGKRASQMLSEAGWGVALW